MNSKRSLLVIGGGSIGERHVRCFQQTGRCAVALCEVAPDVRMRVTRQYGLPQSFASLDEALATSFDAAVICTPAHLHVPMAEQLAGKNVQLLIEKPLSTSLDGLPQLETLVRLHQLKVSVAYVYRAHPALGQMKDALHSGRFGRAVQVVVNSGQHFPLYRPAYREIYYRSRDTGGGAIQDALTHLVNAAEWLVGPVTRVCADAEHCVLPGVEVEDTAHALTRHGAVLGSFSLNQHQPPNESSLAVICERGAAKVEMHHHRWLSAEQAGDPWTVESQFSLERDDLFVRQAKAFLDLLEGAAPPACSLAEGLQTLRVNLAMLRSLERKSWIPVEPT